MILGVCVYEDCGTIDRSEDSVAVLAMRRGNIKKLKDKGKPSFQTVSARPRTSGYQLQNPVVIFNREA